MSKIGQSIETESRWMIARGRGKRRVTADENEVSFQDDRNVLELGCGDGCSNLWVTKKNKTKNTHWIIYFGEFYVRFKNCPKM